MGPFTKDLQTFWNSERIEDGPVPWYNLATEQARSIRSCNFLIYGSSGVGKSTIRTIATAGFQNDTQDGGLSIVEWPSSKDGELQKMFKKQNLSSKPHSRFDAIWFCVDANQKGNFTDNDRAALRTIAKYAVGTPVVLVATKKDEYLDLKSRNSVDSTESQLMADRLHELREDLEQIEEYSTLTVKFACTSESKSPFPLSLLFKHSRLTRRYR